MNEADLDAMDLLVKENQILKQQLQNYFLKVAKTQKVNICRLKMRRQIIQCLSIPVGRRGHEYLSSSRGAETDLRTTRETRTGRSYAFAERFAASARAELCHERSSRYTAKSIASTFRASNFDRTTFHPK